MVTVNSGEAAIARLQSSPPDIVLADVSMPGTSGYDIARFVKQRLAHVPVVLLTGAFEPVDQSKVAEAGCEAVLAKPVDPSL